MNPPLANILLVDDRAEDRAALEVVLAPLGQNLILAESGQDALRHLLKTEFALILLDVEMPLMDGLETAGMIRQRERSQQIPIIFITGVAVTGVERFKGYAAGAVDYMLKPVIPDVLRWKVRVFVDLYRLKAAREEQIRALEVANQALLKALAERDRAEQERAKLATEVKILSGLLPICAGCKKIRDDQGRWNQIESYIAQHSAATFTHGMCPECIVKWYPGYPALAAAGKAA
ncbi:MAG: response regulator [Verrucomicrobiota bacterium]|jgi:CheY-like chemotaxis protein